MASFNKFNQFVEDLAHGIHDLKTGTSHILKAVLTNTAPVATNTVLANITQITAASGYVAGGQSVGTITGAQTSGTFKLVGGTDPVWTASGGAIGPFRYVAIYNSTPSGGPLVGWWDYGSAITLNSGDTFTLDLDQSNGIFTIA